MEKDMKGPELRRWRQIGNLASLGITLVASTAIGLAIGYQLDKWLKTSPWLTILFLLFGIAAGFVNLFRETRRAGEKD
jgi:ATP synthase protein I